MASLSGTVNGVANPVYGYDNNGNLTSGAGRTATWTGWNMPAGITSTGTTLSYVYNADHERVKSIGSDGTTLIYLNARIDQGGTFEREVNGTSDKRRVYFYGGDGPAGVMTYNAAGSGTLQWFNKDHLGSITAITDQTGAVIERLAYDAWGKRRQPNGSPAAGTITSVNTPHGYTGHEMLDSVNLIQMNGRIYDPALGRFMSADPFVQAPDDLQSYNRYAYVRNNPLMYTDPSGFSWWTKWRRTIFAVAIAYFTGYYNYGTLAAPSYGVFGADAAFGVGAANFGNAVLSGAAYGGVQSGTIEGAFQGGFSAALFFEVGSLAQAGQWGIEARALGHAVAGCVTGAVGSGGCKNGALSDGFAEYAGLQLPNWGPVGEGFKRIILGGTASVIGGGKFENGATTAAFGYLFNCLSHPGTCTKADQQEIRVAAAACGTDTACIRRVAIYARESGIPLPADLWQSLVGFMDLTTLPARILTPAGRLLDTGIDLMSATRSAINGTSDWISIVTGDAFGMFMERSLKVMNTEFTGRAGAIWGKIVDTIVGDVVKDQKQSGQDDKKP